LELLIIGQICHAGSQRGFAEWARSTTIGGLTSVDLDCLANHRYWDRMNQVPEEVLASVQREIMGRANEHPNLALDILLRDAPKFFSSIDAHCRYPVAGGNKKERTNRLEPHTYEFTCAMAYFLGRLLHLRARRAVSYEHSMERLLDTLAEVRLATVERSGRKRCVRFMGQLEEVAPEVSRLFLALGGSPSITKDFARFFRQPR
jgi:hypothetical protein